MMTLFGIITLTLLAISAVATIESRNLFISSMWFGIFSLLMAANFFILDAADVALTEAAVGAGVSAVLFLGALALTAEHEHGASTTPRWVPVTVLAIASAVLVYATFQQPVLGDPMAPVHQHVAPWYLSETPNLVDIPNVVAAVLASFRAYDTLGEVIVVFAAGVGVLSVLGFRPKRRRAVSGDQVAQRVRGIQHHAVLRVVGKLIIPFLLLFGLFVQFHGEYTPGGGFPAGALFTAAIMLYAILEGADRSARVMPQRVMLIFAALGATLFTTVGIACILLGGNFLEYNVLLANDIAAQQLGIVLVEFGVGVTVAAVLIAIFNAIANRETY
jgi:multicomponent Na+:H+ antiporter subunit B